MNSCKSSVFTANNVAPKLAPAEVKNMLTATRHSVRRKMSRLTVKKRSQSADCFHMAFISFLMLIYFNNLE